MSLEMAFSGNIAMKGRKDKGDSGDRWIKWEFLKVKQEMSMFLGSSEAANKQAETEN